MNKILIVRSGEGDWEALYIDGKKVCENHSISTADIIRCLGGLKIDYFTHPELEDPDKCNPKEMFPDIWTAS